MDNPGENTAPRRSTRLQAKQKESTQALQRNTRVPVNQNDSIPTKRRRLTAETLNLLDETTGQRKRKDSISTTTTTTPPRGFGGLLRRNCIINYPPEVKTPDDILTIEESLQRHRTSPPPTESEYRYYLAVVGGGQTYNKSTIGQSVYPLLAKRIPEDRVASGYFQSSSYAWSRINHHLTRGLGKAKPDIFESFRKREYPEEVVNSPLSGALFPTRYYEVGMPAFAVELKATDHRDRVKCAYHGALMTEGARNIHWHVGSEEDLFYNHTQAITIGFNGKIIDFDAHHAVLAPRPIPNCLKPLRVRNDRAHPSQRVIQYHQRRLFTISPTNSFADFQTAYKYVRNAQDIGYDLASKRKDELWEYYTKKDGDEMEDGDEMGDGDEMDNSGTDGDETDGDETDEDGTDGDGTDGNETDEDGTDEDGTDGDGTDE